MAKEKQKMNENEELTDIKKLKLEIFEKENPKGMAKIKNMIEKNMNKTQQKITKYVEKAVDEHFKNRITEYIPSYIG